MLDPVDGNEGRTIRFQVNGEGLCFDVPTEEFLATTLRDRLSLGSVRETCGVGICGSCTVLVDGRPTSSCLMLTHAVEGRRIETSEGLESDGGSGCEVVGAFERCEAYQCSYCIPGFAMAVRGLVDEPQVSTMSEARRYLAGNLCRCGTYPQILAAVESLLNLSRDGTDEQDLN